MTGQTTNLEQLETQVLALPLADRLELMQAIVRSIQMDIPEVVNHTTPELETISTEERSDKSDTTETSPDESPRHPLLVMLESLDDLDEEFPDISDLSRKLG
jgi:hypothetical protein